ncbi:MAG: O-antigen polysaccharide polymerase Wzy [Myxococcales bacterium]|nr:O-antigen polysaccharide polymerase Wzy [Myxococcales bacterium]
MGAANKLSAAAGRGPRARGEALVARLSVVLGFALALAALCGYGLLVWHLEITSPNSLGLALSSTLLLIGGAAFIGLGAIRGQLALLWPGFVFPVTFALFHFGSLGTYEPGWYAPELVPLAWAMSAASLLGWMCGYAIARGRRRFELEHVPVLLGRRLTREELRVLAWLGGALFVAGLVLQGVFLAKIGPRAFLDLEYMEIKRTVGVSSGDPLIYVFGIGQLCALAGLTLTVVTTALGRGRLFPGVFTAALVVLYLLSLVVQGDRSQIAVVVFVCALVYHCLIEPLRWRRATVLVVALVMTFAGVKAFRGTKIVGDFVSSSADATAVVKVAEEVGSTLDTVVRAMDIVPSRYDYFYGSTYVHAVARVVPNLRFSQRRWGFVSSIWITRETAPDRFARQGGIGFSVVAEAFINFGVLGAPALLLVIGLIHGWCERWLAGRVVDVVGACVFLIIEVGLLTHVRNSTVLYLRNSLWMITLLLAALVPFFVWFRARRGAPRSSR